MRKPKNYWKNLENIKKELLPICKKLGRMPSYRELQKLGYNSLPRYIIKYHGGFYKVAKKIGFKTYDEAIKRHSHNYWSLENTIKEYFLLIKEKNLDYQPSKKDIYKFNRGDLYGAINKHGGYKKFKYIFKSKYNYDLKNKDKQRIWSEEKVIAELLPLCKKLGYCPSNADLDKLRRTDLRGIIDRIYNNKYFAKKLGYPTKEEFLGLKKSGYWQDFNNVKKELLPLCKSLGRFPNYTDLKLLERIDITISFKYHGGRKKVAKKLGYEITSDNTLKTIDGHLVRSTYEILIDNFLYINEIEHKTEDIIDKNASEKYKYDFLVKDLNNNDVYIEIWGYSGFERKSINSQIIKNYDNKRKAKEEFYKKRNLKLIGIMPRIFDKKFENIYKYLIEICKKNNIKLENFNLKPNHIDLFIANIYSFDDLYNELKPYIEELGGYMPTSRYIKDEGIKSRIQKLGGYEVIKKRYKLRNKPRKLKWDDDKYFMKELLSVCKELNRLPSYRELNQMQRSDLLYAITKRGGLNVISKMIGFNTKTKHGYKRKKEVNFKNLSNSEVFLSELSIISKQLNRLPSYKELLDLGRGDLVGAIKKRGGMNRLARKIGYKTKTDFSNKKAQGYWQNLDNTKKELLPLCKKLNRFPTDNELKDSGLSSITSIFYYHGGRKTVAEKLGYKTYYQMYRPNLKDISYIKKILNPIIKKVGHFPRPKELKDLGYDNIKQAINRYHGGFQNIANIMGFQLNYTPINKYKDWKFVKNKVLELKKQLGHFPSRKEFKDMGYDGLAMSLYRYYGGLKKVRNILENLSSRH